MPILTTSILASLTLPYLTECIISNAVGNSPGFAYKAIPKLVERLKKQFSDTKPEVNGDLQKAILSADWMATTVFVEQMHKKGLLKDSYNNVNQSIKEELKELKNENYQPVETYHDAYDVAKLIKLPEEEVRVKLGSDILEFHLKLLDEKTGKVEELEDYKKLKELIRNGWEEENLNWFQLMTAFLNQLLKGDNNKAKDFFQNQTLSEIKLKLDHFENYAKDCKKGIGEERFKEFEGLLFEELTSVKNSLSSLHEKFDKFSSETKKDIKKLTEAVSSKVPFAFYERTDLFKLFGELDEINISFQKALDKKNGFQALLKSNPAEVFIEEQVNSIDLDLLQIGGDKEKKNKEIEDFINYTTKNYLDFILKEIGDDAELIKIRELYKAGNFELAEKVIDSDKLQIQVSRRLKLKKAAVEYDKILSEKLIFRANEVLAKKENAWFEIADSSFCQAVELHESYDTCFTYAHFLQEHSKFNRAAALYENALKYVSSDYERATTLNNLGALQRAKIELKKAEQSYLEALGIYRKLAEVNPQAYLSVVAMTLNNLGNLQSDQMELEKAEQSYLEALGIYRKLVEVNPQAYLSYVATTLNNLAALQSAKNELDELEKAEESYLEALEIRRKLAKVNPLTNLSYVATTLNNLGSLQRDKNELEKAEESYLEALEIRRKLAEVNPQAYLSDVAMTLNNLGNLQRAKNELKKAEQSYFEALDTYRKLAEVYPQAYLSDVATTLNNLGNLRAKSELEKAEQSYLEALKIRRKLAEGNPQAYLSDVAMTLNNLAIFYLQSIENKEKSLAMSLDAYLSVVPMADRVPTAMKYCQLSIQIWQAWDEDLLKHLEGLDSARPDSAS